MLITLAFVPDGTDDPEAAERRPALTSSTDVAAACGHTARRLDHGAPAASPATRRGGGTAPATTAPATSRAAAATTGS